MSRMKLTKEQVSRLRYMYNKDYSYRAMSKAFGVCTDTVKRMLVREGLAEFDGAKYAISPMHKTQAAMWKRPCLKCGDATPRPKWQYVCDRCKTNADISGLPDSYIEAGFDGGLDDEV